MDLCLVTSSHSALVLVLFTTFFCMVQIRSWEMSWVILISVPSSLSHPCPDSRCVHLVIHSEHARQFRVYQGSRFYMFTSLFEDYALEVPLLILRWCGFLGYMCPYWDSRVTVLIFIADVMRNVPYQHFICSQSLLSLVVVSKLNFD